MIAYMNKTITYLSDVTRQSEHKEFLPLWNGHLEDIGRRTYVYVPVFKGSDPVNFPV